MAGRLTWSLRWRLSMLWFLQWGITGTLMTYLPILWESIELSKREQGQLMAVTAIGLWVAPLVIGQVADRWLSIEICLALSHLIGGLALTALANTVSRGPEAGIPFPMLLVLVGMFAAAYFPTVSLATTLCFRQLSDPDSQFGKVRVWGTVGWMVSGVFLSVWLARGDVLAWLRAVAPQSFVLPVQELFANLPESSKADCFRISSALSFMLSGLCLFMPHTPPLHAHGDRVAPLAVLGMFRDRNFSLFFFVSFLISALIVPLYSLAVPPLLQSMGVPGSWVPTVMLVGQFSEFPALLLLPLCLKRLGLKATFAMGIGAWALRYAIFAIGAPWWLVLAGLGLHGVCHVYLIIVVQLYIDSQARKDLRASVQALLSFVALGVGMPVGMLLGGWLYEKFVYSTTLFVVPSLAAVLVLLLFWWSVDMPAPPEEGALAESRGDAQPGGIDS